MAPAPETTLPAAPRLISAPLVRVSGWPRADTVSVWPPAGRSRAFRVRFVPSIAAAASRTLSVAAAVARLAAYSVAVLSGRTPLAPTVTNVPGTRGVPASANPAGRMRAPAVPAAPPPPTRAGAVVNVTLATPAAG